MKYFIVEGVFNDPVPVPREERAELLAGHKEFVARGLSAGSVLCAGPKVEGSGGFIILRAESREALDEYLNTDPHLQSGVSYFNITEFNPVDRQDCVSDWAER